MMIVRLNESELIRVNDDTICGIVKEEINKFGNKADLNHIDVSGITNMRLVFYLKKFNGDISLWNTENVENMSSMFERSQFNGDISLWNTENVENMREMFCKSEFNGDISNWNVEKVRDTYETFCWSKFSGDLNNWKPRSLINHCDMFLDSPLWEREPIWYQFLYVGLFKSGDDYCDSIKQYNWLRGDIVIRGRLELSVNNLYGDLNRIELLLNKLESIGYQIQK